MQWFEGYAFGRVAQHSLRTLGEIALKKQKMVDLAPHELTAIDFLARRVSEAEALKLSPVSLDILLVFTDGACEGESDRFGSIGGVIVDKAGRCYQHFSCEVPTDFMRVALSESSNPIYELELLPIYVAICIWGQLMQSAHVVFLPGQRCCQGSLVQRLRRHQTWAKHSATCHGGRKQVEAEVLVRPGT